MRIGVNLLPLFPGQIGGMERYTFELLTHLMEIDHQHTYYLFVARYNQRLFNLEHPQLIKVQTISLQGLRYASSGLAGFAGWAARQFPRTARLAGNAAASAHMLWNIQRHKIDLWFCPLINLAPRHVRLPSVVSLPDLQPEFYPDFFRKDLVEWSRKRYPASCRDSTKVITLSEFSKGTILQRYGVPAEKVHAIPLAVGEEFLLHQQRSAREAIKAKYNLPSEYAFYPANTWPHKNHETLVKAMHLLRAKHGRQLACVFTGVKRGAHDAFLKAVEELGLRKQIHVLGYVEEPDMPLLYQGASCLVFPSLFEGFGLPLLEAMASDCPVICSRVASIPEVVGEAALLFDPHDPEEIADAMHRILTDEELRHSLVRAGRDRCSRFSWERTARETLKVLEEAALQEARPSDRSS
jgi:glycosyltransferase involved in cell wall biosynthesis